MAEQALGGRAPRVTVIIATYNWSSVLRHAIASVLAQSFADFELLVVGDGCTDDSEEVARSFGDARVCWENLEHNSGNQSAPNNRGLERARGDLIAYLGHDDVWHPSHLETLVAAIDSSGADLVYSVAEILGAPGSGDRRLMGLTPGERYVPRLFAPPSAILHRASLAREIGGWRDYRTIRLPPDVDFLRRAWEHGKTFVPVNELTVFKFPSGLRPNSYVEKRSDEQAECRRAIVQEPEFRYRELMATLRSLAASHPDLVSVAWISDDVAPGEIVEGLRAVRGLPSGGPAPSVAAPPEVSIAEDAQALRRKNRRDDIAPIRFRQILYSAGELPQDGLYLGQGWHDPERDEWGSPFRWAGGRAEIVVTRPTGLRTRFWMDVFPGPGAGEGALHLRLLDDAGVERGSAELASRQRLEIDFPLPAAAGARIVLAAEGGGRRILTDPRVLDFAIAGFDWV